MIALGGKKAQGTSHQQHTKPKYVQAVEGDVAANGDVGSVGSRHPLVVLGLDAAVVEAKTHGLREDETRVPQW